MIILLLAVLKFAFFLAFVGALALLMGSVISAMADTGRSLILRLLPLPPEGPIPGADALELKGDLARGQRDTDNILAAHHCQSNEGHFFSCETDGGGDSGGCD